MTGRHVLLVDDEQDIRDLVSIWLHDDPRCSDVAEAGDLDIAVRLVTAQRPDAILLDFFLGRRLCIEVLPAIRALVPHALIVVYTASRRAAESAGALAAGADYIVEKGSISVDDVVELLLGDELIAARERRAQSPGA